MFSPLSFSLPAFFCRRSSAFQPLWTTLNLSITHTQSYTDRFFCFVLFNLFPTFDFYVICFCSFFFSLYFVVCLFLTNFCWRSFNLIFHVFVYVLNYVLHVFAADANAAYTECKIVRPAQDEQKKSHDRETVFTRNEKFAVSHHYTIR